MFCPSCGAEQPGDATFCDSCGAALGEEATPEQAPPSGGNGRSGLKTFLMAFGGGAVLAVAALLT